MAPLHQVLTIARKDVLLEVRTRESATVMTFFTALVLFVFHFGLDPQADEARTLAAGLIWVAFVFAAVLGVGRSFAAERENGCLDGLLLLPAGRGVLYAGKFLATAAFLLAVQVVTLPLFAVLFNVDLWPRLGALYGIAVLGTVGLASVGTLFGALTATLRAREAMLPLLLLPVVVPVLIATVRATDGVLLGTPTTETWAWLKLLIVFDVVFLAVSVLAFDLVVED